MYIIQKSYLKCIFLVLTSAKSSIISISFNCSANSCYIAIIANPLNLSSTIVDLKYIFIILSFERLRSLLATVIGSDKSIRNAIHTFGAKSSVLITNCKISIGDKFDGTNVVKIVHSSAISIPLMSAESSSVNTSC